MQNVLITGIGSGIGVGLAKACLARGDRVYALSRKLSPEIPATSDLIFQSQDLADLGGIAQSIDGLLQGVERLDLVVLNAGVLGDIRDLKDTSLEDIQRMMTVNTWANKVVVDALLRLAIPIKQVVGISTGAAVSGSRGWNGYALSKAAFLMLLKLYAAEVPDTHFCSLAPGLVDTGMQAQLASLPDAVEETYPVIARIRRNRGTADMPEPDTAAPRLLACMQKALAEPSGAYLDIRQM